MNLRTQIHTGRAALDVDSVEVGRHRTAVHIQNHQLVRQNKTDRVRETLIKPRHARLVDVVHVHVDMKIVRVANEAREVLDGRVHLLMSSETLLVDEIKVVATSLLHKNFHIRRFFRKHFISKRKHVLFLPPISTYCSSRACWGVQANPRLLHLCRRQNQHRREVRVCARRGRVNHME